jgi:hypothetical protein
MKKSTRSQLVGGGAVLAMVLAGCAGEVSRPDVGQLQEGLNLLDVKEPAWGMSAAFRQGQRVIYLETRVGPLMPEIYRQDDPDGPQNEMDMRLVDKNGNTFYAMRGGDNFVDPTWAAEVEISKRAKVDPAARDLDFRLAKEASVAFMKVAPATFKFHVRYVASYAARPVPSEDEQLRQRAALIPRVDAPGALNANDPARRETGYGNYNLGDYMWLETDKYSGDTGCFLGLCVAKHSATRMWVYRWNNGAPYWILSIDANNHGRHAGDSGMGYNCYSSASTWAWGATISGSTAGDATGNWDSQGGCQTSYSWNSGGWDHLCNDDAAYELWQAKSGGMATTQGDGISFTWTSNAHFACACQNNSGCDGDWSSPNCP